MPVVTHPHLICMTETPAPTSPPAEEASPPPGEPAQTGALSPERVLRAASVGVGVVAALTLGALLYRLTFEGWSHSFDTAIYVRSLWGVAHGEWMNPVRDLHVFTIHGNFVFFALAPLAWLFGATWTLLGAQALAFGATIGVTACAWARVGMERRNDTLTAGALPWLAAFVLIAGTPLLTNPFLFDLRPDGLGVPLITIGLLRAQRLGDVDGKALAWMLSALLVREEYFMTIVGALVLCPLDVKVLRASWKLRVAGCVIAVAWWALYFFGFRALIDDGSLAIAQQVGADFVTAEGTPAGALTRARVTLGVAALSAAGGFSLLGWRWLGAAAPGLLFLALVDRMPELLPNVHYAYFVAPGFAAASVDGLRRRLQASHLTSAGSILHAVVVVIAFATASALPGGGVFRSENFLLLRAEQEAGEADAIRDLQAAVRRVPSDLSLTAPHEVMSIGAERSVAVPVATYAQRFDALDPEPIDALVLPRRDWARVGRPLVDLHGYRVVDVVPPHAAVLACATCAEPSVDTLVAALPRVSCPDIIARWPDVGLEVCRAQRLDDGRRVLPVRRYALPDGPLPGLLLLAGATGGAPPQPALALGGLLSPRDIAEDVLVGFDVDGSIPADVSLNVMLVVPNGGPIGAQTSPDGALRPQVEVP